MKPQMNADNIRDKLATDAHGQNLEFTDQVGKNERMWIRRAKEHSAFRIVRPC